MNSDMVLVTAESHPSLFKAFELISHDNGNQAGHKNYVISMKWEEKLPLIESCLKHLLDNADSDFDTLCIGEETERQQILKRYLPGIGYTDDLLQEFFEEL